MMSLIKDYIEQNNNNGNNNAVNDNYTSISSRPDLRSEKGDVTGNTGPVEELFVHLSDDEIISATKDRETVSRANSSPQLSRRLGQGGAFSRIHRVGDQRNQARPSVVGPESFARNSQLDTNQRILSVV